MQTSLIMTSTAFYWLSTDFYLLSSDFYRFLLNLLWLLLFFYWFLLSFYRFCTDFHWLQLTFYWLLLFYRVSTTGFLLTSMAFYWLALAFKIGAVCYAEAINHSLTHWLTKGLPENLAHRKTSSVQLMATISLLFITIFGRTSFIKCTITKVLKREYYSHRQRCKRPLKETFQNWINSKRY